MSVARPGAGSGRWALLAILAGAVVLLLFQRWLGPYKGYGSASIVISIPKGSSPGDVAARLTDAGVVRSSRGLRWLARLRGVSGSLKAGEYEFRGEIAPGAVLDRLVEGDVLLHRLTIPEGLSGPEVIRRVAALALAPAADLEKAYNDPSPVRDIDGGAENLEGYLFPDTYRFARGTSAGRIMEEMVDGFKRAFGPPLRRLAVERGMSVRQVVTLASLIEKETSVPVERARVSSVFHNRLRLGMALQCDPTVIYALATDGKYNGSLTRDDLEYASPYNTYLNAGLPPGPIASPGAAALRAAVEPAETLDLYFVADGSGGHTFSTSLADHLQAVTRYRQIRKSRA